MIFSICGSLFPTRSQTHDKFAFALSSTLAEDGTPDDGAFDQVRPLFLWFAALR